MYTEGSLEKLQDDLGIFLNFFQYGKGLNPKNKIGLNSPKKYECPKQLW